jgi:hypothetical protein
MGCIEAERLEVPYNSWKGNKATFEDGRTVGLYDNGEHILLVFGNPIPEGCDHDEHLLGHRSEKVNIVRGGIHTTIALMPETLNAMMQLSLRLVGERL